MHNQNKKMLVTRAFHQNALRLMEQEKILKAAQENASALELFNQMAINFLGTQPQQVQDAFEEYATAYIDMLNDGALDGDDKSN